MSRRLRRLGGFIAAGLVLAACGATASPSPSSPAESAGTPSTAPSQAPSERRLVWASRETVDANWALETDDSFILTLAGVGETLTKTGFDGKLTESLATSWARTGDLTWEFTLRDGVTFHDGTALDAAAVAASLNHLLGVEAPARSFNPTSIASVEAVGANVVRITSTSPNALVPLYTASPNTVILAAKAYTSGGIDPTGAGTGPFVIVSQNLPQSFTTDRNEAYWGGKANLIGVEVRLVPDGGTRSTLLQSGEVDVASSLPIPSIPIIETVDGLTVVRGQLARTNSLYLNNSRAPFDNVLVRQAIQAAVDVDAISNAILEGAVAPAAGPFNASAAWAPAGLTPVVRDVEKAKSLLAQAGIAEGSLTLSLWTYPSRAELPDVAVAIQDMLADAGIAVEVRVADYAALEPDLLAGNYDMLVLSRGYLTDINDPAGMLRADYTCAGGYALSHFCDPTVDADLEAAIANEDPAARYAVYSALAARLQADAVDVFLYHPQELAGVSDSVGGFAVHPMEHFLMTTDLTLSQ